MSACDIYNNTFSSFLICLLLNSLLILNTYIYESIKKNVSLYSNSNSSAFILHKSYNLHVYLGLH